jgi:hypothetical protein
LTPARYGSRWIIAGESLTEKAASISRLFLTTENGSLFVMAGLVPAIHAFIRPGVTGYP